MVTVQAQRVDPEGEPRPVDRHDAVVDGECPGTVGDRGVVLDQCPGLAAVHQVSSGVVATVDEPLVHDTHPGVPGRDLDRTGRWCHQHRTVGCERPDHHVGDRRITGHGVIERTVRLHVGDRCPGRRRLVDQRLPLLHQVGRQADGGDVEGTSAEAVAVPVGDVGTDDDAPFRAGRGQRPHHGAVPGMEAACQVGARHQPDHGQVLVAHEVALGEIRVEVDDRHAPSIGQVARDGGVDRGPGRGVDRGVRRVVHRREGLGAGRSVDRSVDRASHVGAVTGRRR